MIDFVIRALLRISVVLGFALIYAPIVTLIVFSFNAARFPSLPWRGFTTEWYGIVTDPRSQEALTNSVVVAVIVAVIATVLGTAAAYFTNRWAFRGRNAYLMIVAFPPCIPLLLLALALLIYFNRLGLSGSLRAVVISHVVISSAFVLGIVRMGLREMDENLERVAWNLGARQWRGFREVVLPQIVPHVIAGSLFAAVVSFDEFIIAFFVAGFEPTLPIQIYANLVNKVSPEINALGTVAFAISISIVIVAQLTVLVLKAPKRLRGRDEAMVGVRE